MHRCRSLMRCFARLRCPQSERECNVLPGASVRKHLWTRALTNFTRAARLLSIGLLLSAPAA